MGKLQMKYNEWVEMQKHFEASTDCGDAAAKSDFESYIEAEIEFEEMLELERYYNRYVK